MSGFGAPPPQSTDPLHRLVLGSRLYAQRATTRDPHAFTALAAGQAPDVLWIGCADSRVPETTVCQCMPGDIFVHRNIANTVHEDDISAASVVEYAVEHLRVKKVVVCGHTRCGGAGAALGDADMGATLNRWLEPVRKLRRRHASELDKLPDDDARSTRLAELNVLQSIGVLEQHPAIKKAGAERGLTIAGLIYDLAAGELKVLEQSGDEESKKLWNSE